MMECVTLERAATAATAAAGLREHQRPTVRGRGGGAENAGLENEGTGRGSGKRRT